MNEIDRMQEEEYFQDSMIQAQCDDALMVCYWAAMDDYYQENREHGDVIEGLSPNWSMHGVDDI